MIKLPIRQIPCDITLNAFLRDNNGTEMSSNEGVKISDDSNSLKAGDREPRSFDYFGPPLNHRLLKQDLFPEILFVVLEQRGA
ncbi:MULTISPECIES: hypothetical protein [Paenibacillus]|uniref:hypothetical protein n=2 Tax=Paenibacillus TaxID=44249 RepID=UPI000466FDC1|nr:MULTISPECIES: hypothetical protein [Paenibacillus]KGP77378.1 hypothetical protein P364_0133315 [Paenibacillus sp. MAEPY2]KGP85244.1 hypothetical protein P363_0122445 [Paenibacillus sp. MAEPY1]OZQ66291.1 hypothetical protein CA599_19040 [Paenibacillus taichungensis]HBU81994.1 hypothetical protein [Paenibacillus sp.]